MTKGISRTETTGPALAEYLGWESDLGRASCRAELVHAFDLRHEPYSLIYLSLTLSISNNRCSSSHTPLSSLNAKIIKNQK
ncbi:hypothetical protein GQ457_01G020400 [Hibiscus cannabinus]